MVGFTDKNGIVDEEFLSAQSSTEEFSEGYSQKG